MMIKSALIVIGNDENYRPYRTLLVHSVLSLLNALLENMCRVHLVSTRSIFLKALKQSL